MVPPARSRGRGYLAVAAVHAERGGRVSILARRSGPRWSIPSPRRAPKKPPAISISSQSARAKLGATERGGFDFDSHADAEDDAAMAAMMENIEKNNRGEIKAAEAAAAAICLNDPEATRRDTGSERKASEGDGEC